MDPFKNGVIRFCLTLFPLFSKFVNRLIDAEVTETTGGITAAMTEGVMGTEAADTIEETTEETFIRVKVGETIEENMIMIDDLLLMMIGAVLKNILHRLQFYFRKLAI